MRLGVLALLGILCLGCQNRGLEDKLFRNNSVQMALQERELVELGTEDLVFPTSFHHQGSFFALMDPAYAQKCYTFFPDGRLRCQVGSVGQGPGEYQMPLAMTVAGDRIFVVSGTDNRINVYDRNGKFLNGEHRNFTGFVVSLSPFGDQVLGAVYSRYTPFTLFVLDQNGKMVRTMADRPKTYDHVFDTLWPAGGVLVEDTKILQFDNFAYAVNVLNERGKHERTVQLASSFYREPDLTAAKIVKGIQAEQAYRASFTPMTGLHAYRKGYVTVLSKFETNGQETQRLEFWDQNFASSGFHQVQDDQKFVGVHGERLVFFENENKPTLRYATLDKPINGILSGKQLAKLQ